MPGLLRVRTFICDPTPTQGDDAAAGAGKGGGSPGSTNSTNPPTQFDQYLDRLVRLIPGEIQGLYMTGVGFIPASRADWLTVWVAVCFVLLLISRWIGTRGDDGRPQVVAILIAAVAYALWVFWMGYPPFTPWKEKLPFLPNLLILVFTFVVPWIYQGDKVKRAR